MKKTPSALASSESYAQYVDEASQEDFKPLSAQEAQDWRQRHPPLSVWRVLAMQAVFGVLVVAGMWVFSGRVELVWSCAYGVLAVLVPAAFFARGLTRQSVPANAGAALMGLFVWESVKIVLTLAMLLAAPKLVANLNWLALLAGFVVTMKVYWVAVWLGPRRRKSFVEI